VLIDEDSLKTIGERYSARWPWPRSLFAAMIASLHQAGAKKIIMDDLFLEQSDWSKMTSWPRMLRVVRKTILDGCRTRRRFLCRTISKNNFRNS